MNGIVAREDFNQAVAIFQQTFPGVNVIDAFKLTQSALRFEVALQANTNQYKFNVIENIAPVFNTEIRLRLQDTFVPTHLGIFLALPTSSTDTAFRLYSYPNQFVFANAIQMRALYNSTVEIKVNNYEYTYDWDVQRHWNSNQTQQTAAFGAASPEDQNNFGEDGFYPMQPYVIMGGSQNIQISLNMKQPPTAVDANSRLIMILRGVRSQNSTPVS